MLGPSILPDFVKCVDGTDDHPKVKKLHKKLSKLNRMLLVPDAVEKALREKLVKEKQGVISKLIELDPTLTLPDENKPFKFYKKLYIPKKEYPEYNFIGVILGPRGKNLKNIELNTGARILIRGRRDDTQGKREQWNSLIKPSEELHVVVAANEQSSLDAAVEVVEKLLVPVDKLRNDLTKTQLREVAKLKAMDKNHPTCNICGDKKHSTCACPLIAKTPGNEQESLDFGSGVGLFSAPTDLNNPGSAPYAAEPETGSSSNNSSLQNWKIDESNLFVRYLPQHFGESELRQLFQSFGQITNVKLIRDITTGVSKGYGFVMFSDSTSAAKAVKHLHGLRIADKTLLVKIADVGCSKRTLDGHAQNNTSSPLVLQNAPDTTTPTDLHNPGSVPYAAEPETGSSSNNPSLQNRKIDERNLFVGYLPQHFGESELKQLFKSFGQIISMKLNRDIITGVSRGSGFVMFSDCTSAAKAVKHLHGLRIADKTLVVKIADAGYVKPTMDGPTQNNTSSPLVLQNAPVATALPGSFHLQSHSICAHNVQPVVTPVFSLPPLGSFHPQNYSTCAHNVPPLATSALSSLPPGSSHLQNYSSCTHSVQPVVAAPATYPPACHAPVLPPTSSRSVPQNDLANFAGNPDRYSSLSQSKGHSSLFSSLVRPFPHRI